MDTTTGTRETTMDTTTDHQSQLDSRHAAHMARTLAVATGSVSATYTEDRADGTVLATATWTRPAPLVCFHPLSCRSCDVQGQACGQHGPADSGHDRCTGDRRRPRTT